MSYALNIGDRVNILTGDEKGSWGIVRKLEYTYYHVAIANDDRTTLAYERHEIRKDRKFLSRTIEVVEETPIVEKAEKPEINVSSYENATHIENCKTCWMNPTINSISRKFFIATTRFDMTEEMESELNRKMHETIISLHQTPDNEWLIANSVARLNMTNN